MASTPNDKVDSRVELGPRSLALLRRAVAALEQLIGDIMSDPGPESEIDTQADE